MRAKLTILTCMVASGVATAAPARHDARAKEEAAAEEDDDEGEADVQQEVAVREKPKAAPKKSRGELYFRAGVAHVEPRIASTGGLKLNPTGIASIATSPEPVSGSITTDPSNIFAGIIGYAPAAFGGYLAFETIIGVPTTSKLHANGDLATKSLAPTALGLIPTGIPPLGTEIGEAKATPPMLTAVLRSPELGPLRPYVGAGVSVLFVDATITNKVLTEVATPVLDVQPAFGFVGQIGVDVHLFDRFYARVDVKELWFQKSESTISNIHVHTTIPMLETVNVGSATSEMQANPYIVQAGVGASF